MIYLGSALMIFNIARYAGFIKKMRWIDNSPRVHRALYLPVSLLVAFLAGYLAVAWFGKPDLIVASILLGGSIFVCIILMVLYFIVEKVMDSQEALLEARQANTAKSQFFANMSHDLRTPLNAIIGYTQLGLRKDTSAEDMHSYLEKIGSSGDHLLTLINDVLEMSRIETGHMELKPAETDLCDVLCGVRDMFAEQMRQKNVAFTVDGDAVQNSRVLCDANRLNRILLNLVSNAYKFTPEGGSVSVTLKQTGRRDDLADGIRRDVLHIHRAGQIEGAVEGSVPFQFRQVGTRRTGLVALQSCFHVKSGPEAVLVFETLFNIVGKAPPEIGQYVNLAHA